MSFWTSERFLEQARDIIQPFDEDEGVVSCSYQLQMGPQAYVTGDDGGKAFLEFAGPPVVIPPGQFALLLTEERIEIPNDTIGFISVRYSFKRRGLVNVSGFHVDPGFQGRLIFSVYNAGSTDVTITRGNRVFLLWLASLEKQTGKPYRGNHQDQMAISDEDIMNLGRPLFSPSALDERLSKVEVWLEVTQKIIIGIVISAALTIGALLFRTLSDNDPGRPIPSPTATFPLTSPSASPHR